MAVLRRGEGKKGPYPFPNSQKALMLSLLCILTLGTLATLYFAPLQHISHVQAKGFVTLSGNLSPRMKQSQVLGPADPRMRTNLMLGLHLRNQVALEHYVNALGQGQALRPFLSPDQIAIAYAPSSVQQQTVAKFMAGAGFTQTASYKQGNMLGFTGTIGQAEQAFHVKINRYRGPDGKEFFAPSSEPGIPATLAPIVQSINGLDTSVQLAHTPLTRRQTLQGGNNTNGETKKTACPEPFAYTPEQIANAYNLKGLHAEGYRGEGQRIALFQLDDFSQSDINAYTACFGGSSIQINRVLVGGASATPGNNALEVELDMELIMGTVPNLAELRVYEAPNTTTGILQNWGQIINDAIPVVGTSWGACEDNLPFNYLQLEHNLFMMAAAQGQTIFAASGDGGTNDCGFNSLGVDDPASQPYVIGVGGTRLAMTENKYHREIAWKDSRGASGGGISTYWPMPEWQKGPGVQNSFSSKLPCSNNSAEPAKYCRQVPDVALNASPVTGYLVYCTVGFACTNQTWQSIGGTSAAAPMWAAFAALANQKALREIKRPLGFLGPLLYKIAQDPLTYHESFHDIEVGDNATVLNSPTLYSATPGYDMVTGLGSYKAHLLAKNLQAAAQASKKPVGKRR